MKKLLIILVLFLFSNIPAFANERFIDQFVTDLKLPAYESPVQIREKRVRKGGKGNKGNLGVDTVSCPSCPVQTCSPTSNSQQCLGRASLINLVAPRYTFSISVVNGQTDSFQLDILNIDPTTGVFKYTATNLSNGAHQQSSAGLVSYDTIHFSVAVLNQTSSTEALIHTLDCTGALQANKTIPGVCSTLTGGFVNSLSNDLVQIAQPFNALPN